MFEGDSGPGFRLKIDARTKLPHRRRISVAMTCSKGRRATRLYRDFHILVERCLHSAASGQVLFRT
jgi:hypothetical protein